MKYNKYVYWHTDADHFVLYNMYNNEILATNEEIHSLLLKYKNNVEALKNIHPSLYNELHSKYYIVENDFNETEELIKKWDNDEKNKQELSLIIIPTLSCNMSCWYCYEKHDGNLTMSTDIIDSIYRLINDKIQSDSLKKLSINFFGGEPLLSLKKYVFLY